MSAKVKLTNWLRAQFLVEREEGRPVRFIMNHLTVSRKKTEIARFDASRITETQVETFCETLAGEIELKATDDAEGLGGVQRYTINCFFKNSDGSQTRYIFKVDASDGEETEDSGEYMTEPPSMKGLISQLMRHNEATMRTATMVTNHNMTLQQRIIERQAEQVEKLLSEKYDNMRTMEGVLSEQHKRKLEEMEQLSNQQFREEIIKKVALLAPVVANRIAGRTIVPVGSPMNASLVALRESLTQEQMQALMGVLRPEQAMAVIEMLQSVTPPSEEEKADDKSKNGATTVS